MKKIKYSLVIILFASCIFSCKKEDEVTLDRTDVVSVQLDTNLDSYYPKPSASTDSLKSMFAYTFPNVDCKFSINMYWYAPVETNGIYINFNNHVGDVLTDGNGFVKAFDSGTKIDSTSSGTWSSNRDGLLSYDYLLYPSANKGNLAGQGDKYIIFRAFDALYPTLKYYGYVRLSVAANGRDVRMINIAYQKNPNASFYTGEY